MSDMVEETTARTRRLLVVDDDVKLCDLVTEYLDPEGFEVEAVHDGERGLERALAGAHALVLLDVMLPALDGFEVLRRIRAKSNIPVLMLTARGDDVDRVVGLEIGADDYLPKPFNPRELVARIRAILRHDVLLAVTAVGNHGHTSLSRSHVFIRSSVFLISPGLRYYVQRVLSVYLRGDRR